LFSYVAGSLFTWFFTLVLWHYYWLLDDVANDRHKRKREIEAAEKLTDAKHKFTQMLLEDSNANDLEMVDAYEAENVEEETSEDYDEQYSTCV
jgi:hypothetical protein